MDAPPRTAGGPAMSGYYGNKRHSCCGRLEGDCDCGWTCTTCCRTLRVAKPASPPGEPLRCVKCQRRRERFAKEARA